MEDSRQCFYILFTSSQIGLFSTFLLVISFLYVKLASPKDNWKSHIPAFVEKFDHIWVEIAIKLTLLTFRIFLFLDKMQGTSKGCDLSKKEWGHCAFKRVKHVYRYKNTHHYCIFLYFYISIFLARRALSMHDVAWHYDVSYVRSKDAHKQWARTYLNDPKRWVTSHLIPPLPLVFCIIN